MEAHDEEVRDNLRRLQTQQSRTDELAKLWKETQLQDFNNSMNHSLTKMSMNDSQIADRVEDQFQHLLADARDDEEVRKIQANMQVVHNVLKAHKQRVHQSKQSRFVSEHDQRVIRWVLNYDDSKLDVQEEEE